jgi:hypothetical protein
MTYQVYLITFKPSISDHIEKSTVRVGAPAEPVSTAPIGPVDGTDDEPAAGGGQGRSRPGTRVRTPPNRVRIDLTPAGMS